MVAASHTVEVDIASEVSLCGNRLEPHGTLLLPDAQLTDHVSDHFRSTRLLAIASVRADWPVEFLVALLVHTLASDSPGSKRGVAVP